MQRMTVSCIRVNDKVEFSSKSFVFSDLKICLHAEERPNCIEQAAFVKKNKKKQNKVN